MMIEGERDRMIDELQMTAFALGQRGTKSHTELEADVWELFRLFTLVMLDELNFQKAGWAFDLKDLRALLEGHSRSRIAKLGGMSRIRLP